MNKDELFALLKDNLTVEIFKQTNIEGGEFGYTSVISNIVQVKFDGKVISQSTCVMDTKKL